MLDSLSKEEVMVLALLGSLLAIWALGTLFQAVMRHKDAVAFWLQVLLLAITPVITGFVLNDMEEKSALFGGILLGATIFEASLIIVLLKRHG